jgi:hypothetical protein
MQNANQSEVARFREQLTKEYEAGQAALYGPSQGSATHLFLNNKTERIAVTIAEMIATCGEEAAIEALNKLQ